MALGTDLGALVAAEYPGSCNPLAAVTQTTDDWDSSTGAKYVTLDADAVRVDVYINHPAYLAFSAVTTAPGSNGALFPAGYYTFKLRGQVYLHVKNGGAGVNVTANATYWKGS